MGYPQHWLLAFGGHQGNAEEIWACGIRMGVPDAVLGLGPDEEQYLDATAIPALTAWFGSSGAKIYSTARLKWVKFNEIDENGLYADQSQTHERLTVDVAGGGGATNVHPLQVAAVLSWRTTAAERGLASRGRIYSPRPVVAVDANGDIDSTARTQMGTAAAALLNALDVSLGVPPGEVMRPMIVSRGKKSGSSYGPGTMNQIDAVVVDSALDIQRRRANHQSREGVRTAVTYS